VSTETEPSTGQQTGPATATPQEIVREEPRRERRHRGRLPDDFTGDVHVHQPHRVGLPPLRSYFREVWRRRQFAFELSRTDLRAQHFNTVFGQLWLVLNPLLLAFVYFLLVSIVRGGSRGEDFFGHLVAGLFAFTLMSYAVTRGSRSVVKGGRLILNAAFPRTLLPLSTVISSFIRFLPTFVIYVPIHLILGLPIGWHLLWVIPIVVILVVITMGLTMLVAAGQVYFRDLANFLPYVTRIWLYASPVLYYAHEVPDRYKIVLDVNPMAPLLTAWSDVLNRGLAPDGEALLQGSVWALAILVIGGLFFISREREFAVRI
jgi:teichoic acid transport system permease protein